MRMIVCAGALLLTACASVYDVTPMGNGNYMVGSLVTGGHMSHAEVKALAIKRADQFCTEQKKQMVVGTASSTGARGWTPLDSEIVFRCD